MVVNEGRMAHGHALNALSYLLNETWSFELLGLVRFELGQAYYMLNRHIKKGECACGDSLIDLNLYRSLLIDVNGAISTESLSPIPLVRDELKAYFSQRKSSHNCICSTLNQQSMMYDV
ncbi:hypothetical protein [Neobacillus sp. LXY-4]|uniref:hypothetical protein n=1 Tax=Neobacillus sp. LXY-4 TaxID=3379826 RepID=UPI003EE0FD9F